MPQVFEQSMFSFSFKKWEIKISHLMPEVVAIQPKFSERGGDGGQLG